MAIPYYFEIPRQARDDPVGSFFLNYFTWPLLETLDKKLTDMQKQALLQPDYKQIFKEIFDEAYIKTQKKYDQKPQVDLDSVDMSLN